MYVRLAVVLYHVCTMLNGCRFQLLWEALGLPNGPYGLWCVERNCLSQGEVGGCPYVLETGAGALCVDMQSLLFFGMPSEH